MENEIYNIDEEFKLLFDGSLQDPRKKELKTKLNKLKKIEITKYVICDY